MNAPVATGRETSGASRSAGSGFTSAGKKAPAEIAAENNRGDLPLRRGKDENQNRRADGERRALAVGTERLRHRPDRLRDHGDGEDFQPVQKGHRLGMRDEADPIGEGDHRQS